MAKGRLTRRRRGPDSQNSYGGRLMTAKTVADLKVALFADGADRAGMLEMYAKPYVKGFTTNPSLMRRAGVGDYLAFAQDILGTINDRPISFEVFADEPAEMERQARILAKL